MVGIVQAWRIAAWELGRIVASAAYLGYAVGAER